MASNGKKTNNGSFMTTVNNLDGDPEILQFFFSQICEIAEINSWTDIQTLAFTKSKLTGNSLKLFISSQDAQNAKNVHELKEIFSKFFRPQSKHNAINELQNFKLLPSESILSMAQKLDKLIRIVYADVKDIQAIKSIKFTSFLAALPANYKIKILENSIQSIDEAIQKAQLLQDLYVEKYTFRVSSSQRETDVDNLSAQVNALRQRISELSDVKPQQIDTLSYRSQRSEREKNSPPFTTKRRLAFDKTSKNTGFCQTVFKSESQYF